MEIKGTYLDPEVNHKDKDYKLDKARKAKLDYNGPTYKFDNFGNLIHTLRSGRDRQMCKKYADGHQRIKK